VVVVGGGVKTTENKTHRPALLKESKSKKDAAVFTVPIFIFFDTSMVLVALKQKTSPANPSLTKYI
jgi:hypothetical protein